MMIMLCRLAVLGAGLVALAVKVHTARTTGGVDDVFLFGRFSEAVHRYGPVMIYGKPIPGVVLPYNHPPLAGLMLGFLYTMQHDYGFSFPLMIRLPAIIADLATTMLVFELVRARRPLHEASVAATVVAASPILFVISGYHGNTDPVFVMFTLLSLYLLTLRQRPLLTATLAGASFAIGLSVKIVPIIVLPLLLLIAARTGLRRLIAYLASSGTVLAVLWLPVIIRNWWPFKTNVLDYAGMPQHQWGLPQIGKAFEVTPDLVTFFAGSGRFLIVFFSALAPMLLAWRRPEWSVPAVGLTFMIFLLLNPSTSTQYLAWAAAPALLCEVWSALAYNVVGGAFLVKVYDDWNLAHPWHWHKDIAWARSWTHLEVLWAAAAWEVLLVAIVIGLLRLRSVATQEAWSK